MTPLLFASIATLTDIIYIAFYKKTRKPFSHYASVFIISFASMIIAKSAFADAEEITQYNAQARYEQLIEMKSTQAEKQQFLAKAEYHRAEGRQCYEDADNMCWYIPRKNDKDMAMILFASCVSAIGKGTLQTIAISSLVTLLSESVIATWEQWDEMNTLLLKAQYHYEMREHYKMLAEKS